MTGATNRSRQPKGIPTGGEFATEAKAENPDLAGDSLTPPAPYGSYYSDVHDLTEILWSNTVHLGEGRSRQIAAEVLSEPRGGRHNREWVEQAKVKAYRIAVAEDTAIAGKAADRELAKARLNRDRVKITRAVNAFLASHPDTDFLVVRYDHGSGGLVWTGQKPDGTLVKVLAYTNRVATANADFIGMDLSDREAWVGFAKDPEGGFGKTVTWDDARDRMERVVIDLDKFQIPTVHDERRHY